MSLNTSDQKASEQLRIALEKETEKFQKCYSWLEQSMPTLFFDEIAQENILLIAHGLVGFDLQEYFCTINIKHAAIVMCLDTPDADLRILKNFANYGILTYQCYVSTTAFPLHRRQSLLRIAIIRFTTAEIRADIPYPDEYRQQLRAMLSERIKDVPEMEIESLISEINPTFLRALPIDQALLALEMSFRSKIRDNCQYEVRYNENWEKTGSASMQIVLAWKNTPKYHFLYQLALVIQRYGLMMKRVNASYIDPYNKNSILIMVLDIHGENGKAAWDIADVPDFLRALATAKNFADADIIDSLLVSKGIVSTNMGNLLRTMAHFIHQALVNIDSNLYTVDRIKADLCRHPELTVDLCAIFALKFHPQQHDEESFSKNYERLTQNVDKLDTGNEENDTRRKNVLQQAMSFIKHCLKTNFYRMNYTALSFRIDPKFLDEIPFERIKKFPELPYAIFFIKGMHFFGFHIRFKDLARGGLRSVYLKQSEYIVQESNQVFAECYNLAHTQHLKNKDIPEGGAKGLIFLNPGDRLESEISILQQELEVAGFSEHEIRYKIDIFRQEQQDEILYQAQRSYIESLITIVNCEPDGSLRAKHIVDYWKRPEYLYLGPDENMHDSMISWIADFSKRYHYKPGSAFISGKPLIGINHKEWGVTSLGVNVYMEAVLEFSGIDPNKQPFTIKLSGGPDGDVAGNQILNLKRYYPKTAKIVALTDISGTIHDPNGLSLSLLVELFKQGKPIKYFPPEELSDQGFLLDKYAKRNQSALAQQTLCWKKEGGRLLETWVSSSEMNQLLRSNLHQTPADIFIPAGGRPRTLSESNVKDFLDETGKPTAKAIIEGANLYLTPRARRALEKLGTIIIKDSSANKAGVICSSFEVLSGLALGDEKFLAHKSVLIQEILARLKECAYNEASLLLKTHKETGAFLTDVSAQISEKINLYTYQILDYLDSLPLKNDPKSPLIQCFFNYCLPTLHHKFQAELFKEIPEHHKKAIIACHLASKLVYRRGLAWEPTIIEVLPMLVDAENAEIDNIPTN